MKQETIDIMRDYISDNPDMNATKLADIIYEDKALPNKSHRTIRSYISLIGKLPVTKPSDTLSIADVPKGDIGTLSHFEEHEESGEFEDIKGMSMEEEHPYELLKDQSVVTDQYEVEDLLYVMDVGKKSYSFSVQVIDKVFCAYSRKGLNLTKHQIITGLNLESQEFNIMTNKLNLTKESGPYGPFTDEFMESEDIYKVVMENTKSLLGIVKDNDSAALETLIKEYKTAYVELCNKNLKYDTFLAELSTQLSTVKLSSRSPIIKTSVPFISGIRSVNVVITDIHFGLNLKNYNHKIIAEKFDNIAKDINSVGASQVNISFLGDTMHTISGVNHANMWKSLEEGAWGANAIIKPFEVLMNFFSQINNLNKIISVSGNHDRMHNDRNLEESNEGASLLFYMIETALGDIPVIHTNHKTLHEDGNLVFINLHGDQILDKKASEKIIWRYGKQGKFNFILEGHFHSRIISKDDDGLSYRKMHCPSICPADGYADRLGVDSVPGWLMIMERDGLPMVVDIPINYG